MVEYLSLAFSLVILLAGRTLEKAETSARLQAYVRFSQPMRNREREEGLILS